jgi:hypothetical protein
VKQSELTKKSVADLRALAKARGIKGVSKLRKAELVSALEGAARPSASRKPAKTEKPRAGARKKKAEPVSAKAPGVKAGASRAARRGGAARTAGRQAVASGGIAGSASSARPSRPSRARAARRLDEQRVKASKYYVGVQSSPELDQEFAYPETHGANVIVLLVRDPYWLFAYWEFAPSLREDLIGKIGEEDLNRSRLVLRVYDVTGTDPDAPESYHDIDVAPEARNWYINVSRVEREYAVDIGVVAPDGTFVLIARSNRVSLPPVGPSGLVDEEWAGIEELYELFVRSGTERGPTSGSGGWGSGGFGR